MARDSQLIHPTAVIGPGVTLADGVSIGPYAVLTGPLRVGQGVWIGAGCAIGAPPEITSRRHNLAWTGDLDHAGVIIERGAVLRELVVVHQGSHRATTIGTGSWLLNRCYVAHDVVLGAGVTVSAGVSIGGHCTIRTGVNIGMNASVHQGRSIGARAMVGMGATVARDVPPFARAYGVPLRLAGVNVVGMRRADLGGAVQTIQRAYASGRQDLDAAELEGMPPEVRDEFAWWASVSERRAVRVREFDAS